MMRICPFALLTITFIVVNIGVLMLGLGLEVGKSVAAHVCNVTAYGPEDYIYAAARFAVPFLNIGIASEQLLLTGMCISHQGGGTPESILALFPYIVAVSMYEAATVELFACVIFRIRHRDASHEVARLLRGALINYVVLYAVLTMMLFVAS